MFSQEMYELGTKPSVIRELFEYGKKRAGEIGAENVFDFTLGNPGVAPPQSVTDAINDLLATENSVMLHGYTSAQGDLGVRTAMANYLNKTYGETFSPDNFYMTCGAAASLMISLKALVLPGEEVIIFAPCFPEYNVFVNSVGGKPVMVPPRNEDFQIDIPAFTAALNKNTKAVIVNSPNNPSGVVYSEATIKALCDVLQAKSQEYAHPIYLITDEPYRELVYDDVKVPFVTKYYHNTLICYSFSKSLSLPGERIGYIAVSPKMEQGSKVYAAICGAGRSLGFVCAPSLFQKVVARCVGQTADLSFYKKNRDILTKALKEQGYRCISPDGAFYLFVEALEADANAFCEKAKKYELLLVPGDDFGCPGFVRISYCVKTEVIEASLPAFAKLAEEYK